jgi:hypothetical protein
LPAIKQEGVITVLAFAEEEVPASEPFLRKDKENLERFKRKS